MTVVNPPQLIQEDDAMLVPNSEHVDQDPMDVSHHTEVAQANGTPHTVVKQEMVDEPKEQRFTWTIEKFSKWKTNRIYSNHFRCGGFNWRVLIIPQGNKVDQISLYLDVADSICLPYGWSCYARFAMTVIDQIQPNQSVRKDAEHQFHARESDWGFTSFIPLSELYDSSKGFLLGDTCIIEADVSVRDVIDYWAYDSKKTTGYVGLKNQGMTCYMNSLLQYLYHIPYFRKAVYHMPTTENETTSGNIPLALQTLFYKLQYHDTSVSTKGLTKSFGWEAHDSFVQHDVQEFNRVLSETLDQKMKGTVVEGTIQKLFEGHHMNYIECMNVDFKSAMKESFHDIQLDVKGCQDVYASFDKYVAVEHLVGDNKYDAAEHGLQDAKKGVLFSNFPLILQLQLKRFDYTDDMVKIHDRYEFPIELDLDREEGKYLSRDADRSVRNLYTLHSVLVHSGGVHGGHYYVYIGPTFSEQWFKFDDERVTKEDLKSTLEELYGGDEAFCQTNPGYYNAPFKFTRYSNAYMLVYIRKSEKEKIICDVHEEEIAEHLRMRLKKEQEEKDYKKRYKEEAHLFTVMKVARDDDLFQQIGTNIYFDLVDHEKVNSFRIEKQTPFLKFKEEVAKEFGIPAQFQRYWIWAKRQNQSYRPLRPLTPHQETQLVGQLKEPHNKSDAELNLFLETVPGLEQCRILPPYRVNVDILVFFKLYDPKKENLRYVGRLFVNCDGKPIDILRNLNELAGFPPDEEIELYEEVKFEPCVMCEPLDMETSFRLSQIENGDIICFQKRPQSENMEEYKYPDIPSYLEYVKNRQALKVMGRKGKKNNQRGKKRKSKTMDQKINSVLDDDTEFLEFSIAIPSIEKMIEENFPIIEFDVETDIDWCCNNLKFIFDIRLDAGVGGLEWEYAWSNLSHDGKLDKKVTMFALYPKEDQERFVKLMLNDIKQSKTRLRYKKWRFVLHKEEMRKIRQKERKTRKIKELVESKESDTSTTSSCEETNKEADKLKSSCEERRTSKEDEDLIHKIKLIEFNGRFTPIILQGGNGPCALLAICNVLLLRNDLQLDEGSTEISQQLLLSRVFDELNKSKNDNKDAENITDAIPCLATGTVINIKFNGITEFEYTKGRGVFDLLKIPLYHGWIVDPKDTDTRNAIGSKSYDTINEELFGFVRGTEVIEDKKRSERNKKAGKGDLEEEAEMLRALRVSGVESRKLSKKLMDDFLETNRSQLTTYGLSCLQEQVKEKELCVLFRNDHFSTMYKLGGQLYLLATDESYQNYPNHNWEILKDVKGNSEFVRTFKKLGAEDDHEFRARTDAAASDTQPQQLNASSGFGWFTAPQVVDRHKFANFQRSKDNMTFLLNLPRFLDGDSVMNRSDPFTLDQWLKSHKHISSRWLPSVLNDSDLRVTWHGDRLKKECLAVMQSIVVAVMDYHSHNNRPHGNLRDHRNMKLHQYILSLGGHQQVRYRVELLDPHIDDNDSELLRGFALDMHAVKMIILEILDGKSLCREMIYLCDQLLPSYPFSEKWKNQFLRNFTGFWDSKTRANFVVHFYYSMACDWDAKYRKNLYYIFNRLPFCDYSISFTNYSWIHKIPKDTFFYNVLTFNPKAAVEGPAQTTDSPQIKEPPQSQPQYEDFETEHILKYYRACLHHNRDSSGGGSSLDTHTIEVSMTNLFQGFIFGAYWSMCYKNVFLG